MALAALRRLDDALGRGEDIFLAVSHGIVAALIIAAVFFRYVLSDPLVWSEEFVIIVFSWMLFIGLASGFRYRMHIRVDALLIALPRGGRAVFGAVAAAATLLVVGLLAWYGTLEALAMLDSSTPMMRVSMAWAVSSVPVGAALSCIHVIRHALCEGLAETLWPDDLVAGAEGDVV